MRIRLPLARVEAVCVALAVLAGAQASPALADTPSPPTLAAVAPATFPPELSFARQALAEHVRMRLRESAVDVAPAASARARLDTSKRDEPPTSCALVATAAAAGVTRVVLADLRATERGIDVALRVYEPLSCKLVTAARTSGSALTLGATLDAALARILPTLGGSAELLAPVEWSLGELAAESRALALIDARELARAWRALDGDRSPLATSLRGRLEEIAAEHETSAAERVRLHSARGQATANDVAARQIIMAAARSMDGEPVDARVLLAAGELQLNRGEAGEARIYLEKAATLAPDNPEIHLGHGRALALLADDAGARASFERAAALEPDSGRALEELAQLESIEPARQAAVLLRAGERATSAFDQHSAEADFQRALELDPKAAAAVREHQAVLFARVGDAENARTSWQESIDAGGVTPARLLGVAQTSHALGDAKAAEAAFRRAAELDPKAPGAALGLGEIYTETGRFEEGRPWLERAAALAPQDPKARLELATVLQRAGESDAALELLRAADLAPAPTPNALRMRASILRARGDGPGARASLERAVELDPVDFALHLDLASVHEQLGDGARASLEREYATLLSVGAPALAKAGSRVAPDGAADTKRDLGPVDDRLAALVQSFVAVTPETGRVALVGVRESIDFSEEPLRCLTSLRSCFSIRVPDRAHLDLALARVIGGEYALIPRKELEGALENLATDATVSALFRFENEVSLDAVAVNEVNLALGSDALFLARVEREPGRIGADGARCGGETPWRLELRQLSGRSLSATRILGNALCLESQGEYSRWNPLVLSLFGVVGVWLSFQLLRGWGGVSVTVELPPQTRALFSISLSRRPRKPKATKSLRSRERAKSLIEDGLRRLNRYEHVLRQGSPTHFTWIPARWRPFYVTVRGPLINSATGELIGDFLEEQVVRVRRGKPVPVRFDLRPKETVVEITVSGAAKATGPVALALAGVPSSLRYANEGGVFLYLQPGKHTLLVGAGDRLHERLFEIRSYDTLKLAVDLSRPLEWLLTGSAAAVTAYLEGDVARAADELDRAGQATAASRLRAKLLRAKGEQDTASRAVETGGDPRAGAEPARATQDPRSSAALFADAGEFAEAADAYRAAGDLAAASRAYESAGDFASAIECARETGDDEYLLALYEKHGDSFEAGELAKKARQTQRAIHAFMQVDRIDANYRKACQRLVELHMERGQLELALDKLEELVGQGGGKSAPLPLRSVQARLLEKLERGEEALAIWESIAERDASFPDAASHIAELRAKYRVQAPAAVRASDASTPSKESRYELLEELGRGAMGVVYKARDKHLGRIVALKRLTDNLRGHPTAIAYFEREARSAAVLNHANIVVVYDAGQENGQYFITMEHLQGTTLEQILSARGAMTASIVASLGIQVCAGLHYAHTNKIIHRDIKTANLFFTRERVVKIMDFGLAKMVEEVRKGATMISGTPYYMAPEQALGENVDHRADLYALGVTFWNLLTNAFPFESGDVTFHHRNTPAPDVRERVSSVPAAMAELVAKLMAKRPEERCQSAAEVAHGLQSIATASAQSNPG